MKKLYKNLLTLMMVALPLGGMTGVLSSCSEDNDPFITASENDAPRILNTDLEEGKGGNPPALQDINRDANFIMEAIVTPTQYTTVTWYIDGELVHTGLRIDMPLLAGKHTVKLVATTTKGKETSRTFTINVKPLADDPALKEGTKARWCQIGTTKSIEGTNIQNVKGVILGGIECTNVSVSDNGELSFEVPEMEEGEYQLTIVTTEGEKYGCGVFTVSKDKFVEGEFVAIWEGNYHVTWDTPFKELAQKSKEWIEDGTFAVGKTLRVNIEGSGQGCIASGWWRNLATGFSDDDEGRGDTFFDGAYTLELELSQLSLDLITQQDGLFIVGNDYYIKSIEINQSNGTTLWEGSYTVTWATPFNELAAQSKEWVADGTIKIGKKICAYVSGKGQGCIATAWWRNLATGFSDDDEGRGDTVIDGDDKWEVEITQKQLDLISQQDGLFVVGDGYTLTKLTIE